jgi:GNAT superfamily N-acetyltransferase
VNASSRARLERLWAERLGCAEELLREPGAHLLAHPHPATLYAVAIDAAQIVLAPPSLHAKLRASMRQGPLPLEVPAFAALVPSGARAVGPAFVGYRDSAPPEPAAVERLTGSSAALEPLREAVSELEWAHANLEAAVPPLCVVLSGGSALAAAGAQTLPGELAHIGVLTHPEHRGRGMARRVVAACAAEAIAAGRLAQYQTLLSNAPALAVGRALGFEPFAHTLMLRWA